MILYLTTDSREIVKKNYIKNIEKEYNIIDTIEMRKLYNIHEDSNNNYRDYILNTEIKKQLKNTYENKKILSLVYIIKEISDDFLINFFDFLKENDIYFTSVNLIDYHIRIDKNLHSWFDNIL